MSFFFFSSFNITNGFFNMNFVKSFFRKKSIDSILERVSKNETSGDQLSRHLTLKDLITFGIAAIIGAGIFSTIGNASHDGGPAVIFLFLFIFRAFRERIFTTVIKIVNFIRR